MSLGILNDFYANKIISQIFTLPLMSEKINIGMAENRIIIKVAINITTKPKKTPKIVAMT